MKKLSSVINRVSVFLASIFWVAVASADYDISAPTTGPFAKFSEFVQDVVNLIDGPIALGFSFLSIAGLAFLWALAPRTPIMGTVFRVVVAVVIILNVGVWITALDS